MYQVPFGMPGIGVELENYTGELVWGGNEREVLYGNSMIDGATRFGSSVILRPGMLLGKVTTGGKLKQWDPEATDGAQQVAAILEADLRMVDLSATNTDVLFRTIRKAPLIAGALFIGGAAMVGHADEWLARRQLAELGCRFDDGLQGNGAKSGELQSGQIILDANTTLGSTHYNHSIVVTGSRTITLPAAVRGVEFQISASGGLVTFAGAVAGTVAAGQTVNIRGVVTGAATSAWVVTGASAGQTLHSRQRFTIAQINAGATILPAVAGVQYRLADASMIAIGGAAAAATTVDILATQGTASVKLLASAVAGLTQNTLLRAGATNAAILAGGLSFVANDVNTAVTIGKTGSDVTTATHVDVLLTYATN